MSEYPRFVCFFSSLLHGNIATKLNPKKGVQPIAYPGFFGTLDSSPVVSPLQLLNIESTTSTWHKEAIWIPSGGLLFF